MNEQPLDRIIRLGKDLDDPSDETRERLRGRVLSRVGIGAAVGAATGVATAAATAEVAKGSVTGASLLTFKTALVGLTLVAAGGYAVARYDWSTAQPQPPAVAPPASAAALGAGSPAVPSQNDEAMPIASAGGRSAVRTEPSSVERTAPKASTPFASSAAIVPRPSSTAAAAGLAAELATLREARKALRDGNAELAVTLLEEQAAKSDKPLLAEEATATRVFALCHAGRQAEAASLARSFLAKWSKSPLTARVRASCAFRSRPAASALPSAAPGSGEPTP